MRTSWSALALSAVFFAGCSSDETSSDTSTGSDDATTTTTAGDVLPEPCALGAASEIAELLDRPVGEPTAESYPDASLCTWRATEPSSIGADTFPSVSIGLIQIGEANAGNRQRLDEVLALGSTDAREIAGGDAVGAFRICEDSETATPETCEAWDQFVVVYESFYLEIDMTNYAWPTDYERERVAEIVEAVAIAAAARV